MGERGALSLAVAVFTATLATAGAGVGIALDQADVFGGGAHTTVVNLDAVDVTDCPSGTVLGQLHRGDRVYATGRDESGDWIEIRDPATLADRIWINAPNLVPDDDLATLDVHPCTPTITTTTTAVPEAGGEATTTTTPGSTASGGSAPGGGSTPPAGPSDTTGPTITGVTSTGNPIWESQAPFNKCTGTQFGTALVSATVSDPSGVASVTMAWSVNTTTGSKAMTSSNGVNFNAVLGTFAQTTIDAASATIALTITARDGAGNTRTATSAVTLNNCTSGPA